MMPKEELQKKFSQDPYRYYHVKLFDELGFKRKRCNCGKFFWTLADRDNCPDSSCTPYGFINDPPSNLKTDYIKLWKNIEKFFVKNGHTSIPSYPTVCRWFPGLYFNIASIVSFQRSLGGKTVFEFPANPLIIPQVCLRFNDIPNVGVSGRHHTSLTMIGQHSMYDGKNGYWKDRCIELDWLMLTQVLKIPAEDISFIEDVWVGPSAFGYSLEYFVRGLELGNAVFTEFLGTPDNFKTMDRKIIDMGAGYERMVWLLSGTPTSYDAVFGPVIKKLKGKIEYDEIVFNKYSKISSILNVDEHGFEAGQKFIEKQLGMNYKDIRKSIEQLEAVYAIADHTKSLLYAIVDGQLPNNVGGGYNLRVILRRSLGFIQQFDLDIDLFDVCKMHAKYLKPFDKRLMKGLSDVKEIIDVEKKRFYDTTTRSMKIIEKMLENPEKMNNVKLIELYESDGITPEMITSLSESRKININIPTDLYTRLSEKHMGEKTGKIINLPELPNTEILFYENQNISKFNAKVLKIMDKDVILNKTYFYGRSGGQEPDHGTINGCNVYDAEKIGDVIIHRVDNINFKEGDYVTCTIDELRRQQLMIHHTGTHVLNASAKKILGNHVWQHSALKDVDKARLDITHYELLDYKKLDSIEDMANRAIKSGYVVKKCFLDRSEAEKIFGFSIYQGGAVPEGRLRIVEIKDNKNKIFDVEACGGIHCDNTKELKKIIIIKQERIQDGVIRLIFAAGNAANLEIKKQKYILSECSKILNVSEKYVLKEAKGLMERWKKLKKLYEKMGKKDAEKVFEKLKENFVNNILIECIDNADMNELQNISKILSANEKIIILFGVRERISVFASSGEKTYIHIGSIVSNICKDLDGKGGGGKNVGQGIGNNKDRLSDVMNQLRRKYQGV